MSDDDRVTLSVTMDHPEAPSSDESDIGIRRQFKAMRTRLQELELLYATRFRHQVPVSISELKTEHGLKCGFHQHVTVSMITPSVQCGACGEELDPLDVLRQFTKEERSFAFTLEHLRKETADLRAEVVALKKQKAALRTAVRKAGGKPIENWQVRREDGKTSGE